MALVQAQVLVDDRPLEGRTSGAKSGDPDVVEIESLDGVSDDAVRNCCASLRWGHREPDEQEGFSLL